MSIRFEKLKKTFGKLNRVSKGCIRFGIILSFFMELSALICLILDGRTGEGWKYLIMSQDFAVGGVDCLTAVVITALFWDIIIKLEKYEE